MGSFIKTVCLATICAGVMTYVTAQAQTAAFTAQTQEQLRQDGRITSTEGCAGSIARNEHFKVKI